MKPIDRSNKSTLLTIMIVTGLSVLMIGCDYFLKKPSFEEVMREPTKSLNKKRMTMIDGETRFDSAVILPNRIFQYNSTLINHDSTTLNVTNLKKDAYPVLLKRIKTENDFQVLRENNASVVFRYRDRHGHILFEILISPEQYSK